MNWKSKLARGYTLYAAVGIVVLMPFMSYHVISEGLPKKILLFVIPAYAILAWSFFAAFKGLKPK